MRISGSVVLVTGANRGIGAEFVRQLRARGAAKVYAAARDPRSVPVADGVEAIALDVTDRAQVASAAARGADAQIVINNAGIVVPQPLLGSDREVVHREFETNVFGPLNVAEAFAPILGANGGGAIVNSLSAGSWLSIPGTAFYCATKAAAWSLTDALRLELAGQGTQVLGLVMGPVDTDMAGSFPFDESQRVAPAQVVTAALDGLEAGESEVLADETTRFVKSALTEDPSRYAKIFAG